MDIEGLARQARFQVRKPRKIAPSDLLRALCLLLFQPGASLQGVAIMLGLNQQQKLSKQAVAKRLGCGCLRFIQEVVLIAIRSAAALPALMNMPVFAPFKRVLIQDSTCIGLPDHLAHLYPGCRNQHQNGKSYAILRLQAVYNLLSDQCIRFSCRPYTSNDQKASPDILELAQPGDLVLRDLGYFVLSVFAGMQQRGIYFLSRLHHGVQIWTSDGVRWRWAQAALINTPIDTTVWLGEDRLPVRLIARPVPESVAAARRRKLYRDCRNQPGQERLALLHWDVFITNVPDKLWTTEQALGAYRARWRIETVFKSWKSGFRITSTLRGSAQQVEACLYAQLLLITLTHHTSLLIRQSEYAALAPPISILKYARFWGTFGLMIMALITHEPASMATILELVHYHCRMDKRKRKHYEQYLETLS